LVQTADSKSKQKIQEQEKAE